jgi:endonuclease YncB( thermonuclease family)
VASKPFGPYSATVVSIHDGDTLSVDVVLVGDRHHRHDADRDLGFNVHEVSGVGIVLERQAVRLVGCDAPELRTIAGKEALAFLETFLKVGDVVGLVSLGWDKYGGRVDGKVRLADGRDLTQVMIDAGHAAAWDGQGPRPA